MVYVEGGWSMLVLLTVTTSPAEISHAMTRVDPYLQKYNSINTHTPSASCHCDCMLFTVKNTRHVHNRTNRLVLMVKDKTYNEHSEC